MIIIVRRWGVKVKSGLDRIQHLFSLDRLHLLRLGQGIDLCVLCGHNPRAIHAGKQVLRVHRVIERFQVRLDGIPEVRQHGFRELREGTGARFDVKRGQLEGSRRQFRIQPGVELVQFALEQIPRGLGGFEGDNLVAGPISRNATFRWRQ